MGVVAFSEIEMIERDRDLEDRIQTKINIH